MANPLADAAQLTDPEPTGGVRPVVGVLCRGLVDFTTPIARADDAGLTRGDGCFEGLRVVAGAADNLDAHLARFAQSAAALEIAFDEASWRELIDTVVAAWPEPGEAAMKLLLTRGPVDGVPTGFAAVAPLPPDYARLRRAGLTAITLSRGYPADAFAAAPWLLGGVKTLSYAVNMAAHREAARRGVDEVIFVSSDGYVLEAPTATVIWAVGRTLHTTPTGETGILGGTTQQRLFERAADAGWQTEYTLVSVDQLHEADAVWVTSSVRGPVDVVDLDGTTRARNAELNSEIRRLSGFAI